MREKQRSEDEENKQGETKKERYRPVEISTNFFCAASSPGCLSALRRQKPESMKRSERNEPKKRTQSDLDDTEREQGNRNNETENREEKGNKQTCKDNFRNARLISLADASFFTP